MRRRSIPREALPGTRLLCEPLEQRSMLSLTIGVPEFPVGYLIASEPSPTPPEDFSGLVIGTVVGCECLPFCVAFPPPTFTPGETPSDCAEPVIEEDPSWFTVDETIPSVDEPILDPIENPDPELVDPELAVWSGVPDDLSLLDEYRWFVELNPSWPDDHGAGGIEIQVVTPSEHVPSIELGTPGAARAFDTWYEMTHLRVDIPVERLLDDSGIEKEFLEDGALVDADVPLDDEAIREQCELPYDVVWSDEVKRSAAVDSMTFPLPVAGSPPEGPSIVARAFSGQPSSWMAAMASGFSGANGIGGADGDGSGFRSSNGRRRGR